MAIRNLSLNTILDDEFVQTLAKSADLYKIGSNSVLDPEEIRIGLKVVPRAVMSLLISELVPMELNAHKQIPLPFGKEAHIKVNKNAADDYTGSIYSDNKLVYDFMNRSIPGLGIILMSTFELYDLEDLKKAPSTSEHADKAIQKLIDERMELHSLVGRVIDEKLAQREVLQRMMMNKLTEALKVKEQISDVTKIAKDPGNAHATEYHRGMANGLVVADSIANGKEPQFVDPKKPIEIKPQDITKKEPEKKKGSPLKDFMDRKKKPKEYHVEMTKTEAVDCDSCGKTIFGQGTFSGCICYGQDQFRKMWIKKSEDGLHVRFSRGWDADNIEMLLDTLRKSNGRH